MPWISPTLEEQIARTAAAFRANMKGSDAQLYPNNVAVAAKVMAAGFQLPLSFIEYIAAQAIAHTAEGAFLERHCFTYGLARLAPTYAQGQVELNGDVGVSVPAGLVVQRADGIAYDIVSGAITDGSGIATVGVRAQLPGRAGNAVPATIVNLTAPLDRINQQGEVAASGIGNGADTESDAALQSRLLDRKRNVPQSGAAHDYVTWVRQVNAGITRVFVDPITAGNGRTSVGVWFLMDDTYTNGIPLAADIAAVVAYIEALRPAGAIVAVAAPTPVAVNVNVGSLASNTLAVKTAVSAELAALFRRGVRVSTATEPFTLYRSIISEAISAAIGESRHVLVAPASDVAYTTGQLPVLGTITFS